MSSIPIFIHHHIFKAAGTSLIKAFSSSFPERVMELEPDDAHSYLTTTQLEECLTRAPQTVLISSHRLKSPLPATIAGRPAIPIIIIRDPILRLLSAYRFERLAGRTGPHATLAKTTSPSVFANTIMAAGQTKTITDVQSAHNPLTFDTQSDPVRQSPKHSALLGLVECFGESMAIIEANVRRWYPDCDLSGADENRTEPKSASLNDLISSCSEFDDETLQRLIKLNKADLDMYAAFLKALRHTATSDVMAKHIADFKCRDQGRTLTLQELPTAPCLLHKQNLSAARLCAPNSSIATTSNNWIDISQTDTITPKAFARAFRITSGTNDIYPITRPRTQFQLSITVQWNTAIELPVIGATIRGRTGQIVWCINSFLTNNRLDRVDTNTTRTYSLQCEMPPLSPGLYSFDIDLAEGTVNSYRMLNSHPEAGVICIPAETELIPAGSVLVLPIYLVEHEDAREREVTPGGRVSGRT